FDSDRPTIVAFGGGNCNTGSPRIFEGEWQQNTNWITIFDSYKYSPPYYKYGDMVIVYLSSVAPDYKQPIQTLGTSTGGMPAIDVANRLNSTYSDPRYAVNRVTFCDVACRSYTTSISTFLDNPVDGEQCWIDNYIAKYGKYYSGTLNITFPGAAHSFPKDWVDNSQYDYSWPDNDMYNGGITAGFYYSVAGPGKNLQLAADTSPYYFKWINSDPDYLVAYSSSNPGRLPEPVTLVGPADGNTVDANGAVFSCEVSENAVRYQLLFGADPYCVTDYTIISDTPDPPSEIVTAIPLEQTWWTIKVYDQFGSTIYADPICVYTQNATVRVTNLTTQQNYVGIQIAIDEAVPGDEIVVHEGVYYENIDFGCKNIKVRSANPYKPTTVRATVIKGSNNGTVVNFANGEEPNCVLAGFTITGGIDRGILCINSSPTIHN
ncbi:MAG: hypothetical protein ACYTBP_11590, partial [Planctomycetota bacterium]